MEDVAVGAERRRKVLLVEDDKDEVDMYAAPIREAGWEVDSFDTGAGVFEEVVRRPPDVIVADLKLPEVDGISLLYKLKSDPRTAHLPVVVVSGFLHRAKEAYAAGCHMFLTKPCLPDTLVDVIDSIWLPPAQLGI